MVVGCIKKTLVTVGFGISVQCHLDSGGVRMSESCHGAHSQVPCIFFINWCVLCKVSGEYFGSVNCKVTLFNMSPKEKNCNYYIKLYKKNEFSHKFVVSLVLLAMMLKYSRFKIHIPVEY